VEPSTLLSGLGAIKGIFGGGSTSNTSSTSNSQANQTTSIAFDPALTAANTGGGAIAPSAYASNPTSLSDPLNSLLTYPAGSSLFATPASGVTASALGSLSSSDLLMIGGLILLVMFIPKSKKRG